MQKKRTHPKKKWLWLIPLVLLAAAGGGYAYYTTRIASAQTAVAEEDALQTTTARRGDLEITATGTGTLTPASQISLGFDESGALIELAVAAGDQVEAGALLARLQTNNTPAEIAATVADAQLSVIQAQSNLDALYASSATSKAAALNDIATYAQEVRDAQYQLDNYTLPTYLQGMDAIEALDKMKAALEAAQAAFEPYRYAASSNSTRRTLLEALNVAQSNYDAAVKRLNYEYALQVAQANLDKARQEYEKYKDGPAADDLAEAQAVLSNAQARLELEKQVQSIIELTAPMKGTILEVTGVVGEALGASTFITLADLEQPMLDVYLDETDLGNVAVGYAATIVFDALPDLTFTGKVISVNPSLQSVANVSAIQTVVQIDADSLAAAKARDADLRLPVGLSASVDIIAGSAVNAVLVPVEALRDLGDGEYAVFVMEDGQPVMRLVTIGLMDVTYVEITSGLEAGETVTTGIVQTK